VLTLVLVRSSSCCIGQEEARSDKEVRILLTEAARLTGQVESLRDRMVVQRAKFSPVTERLLSLALPMPWYLKRDRRPLDIRS
jgi:hypothetical protein